MVKTERMNPTIFRSRNRDYLRHNNATSIFGQGENQTFRACSRIHHLTPAHHQRFWEKYEIS